MCTNKEAIDNAAASVEFEGFKITEQDKKWCEKLLSKEITFDEYMAYALGQIGVTA